MRFVLALSVAVLAATQSPAATTAPSDSSGIESLGRGLLDDLTPDVLKPPSPAPSGQSDRLQRARGDSASPAPRFDDLGSDIGAPSGPLSLVRVRQGMQHAESLLGQQNAAADTRTLHQAGTVQQQVVAQLDKLIEELSKQCQGGQCQQGDGQPQPDQQSQSQPADSTAAAGRTAARDSDTRLDGATAQPAEKADLETLINTLWGHLPDRAREQMLQSFSDEFLPKYELEIEQYYRRLSEENGENRPR